MDSGWPRGKRQAVELCARRVLACPGLPAVELSLPAPGAGAPPRAQPPSEAVQPRGAKEALVRGLSVQLPNHRPQS